MVGLPGGGGTGPRRDGVASVPAFPFALAGLLLGHALTYVLASPDAPRRAALLRATGHGYLPLLHRAALILAVAGVAALVARASWRRAAVPRSVARLTVPLAATQVVAFVAQEIVERAVVGAPLNGLAPILAVGVPAQIVLAVLAAYLFRWLTRTAAGLAESAARAARGLPLPPPAPVIALGPSALPRPTGNVVLPLNVRAPPRGRPAP